MCEQFNTEEYTNLNNEDSIMLTRNDDLRKLFSLNPIIIGFNSDECIVLTINNCFFYLTELNGVRHMCVFIQHVNMVKR